MAIANTATDKAHALSPGVIRILAWLGVFLPAIITGVLVYDNAVNVPVWDDWERGVLIDKASSGDLDLRYLASAHIDHRPLLPRLLTLGLNELTGGDLRAEMWVSFASICIASLFLIGILRRALPSGPWLWGCALAMNLMLFSPMQYQNLLWGTQMAYMLPLMFLCAAMFAMSSEWLNWGGKIVVGALCATLATWCFGHGILVWPVVVCMALLSRGEESATERFGVAGALIASCTLVMVIYFGWGFINTSHPAHAFGVEPGERPPGIQNLDVTLGTERGRDRLSKYFWTSLGNPYARVTQSDPKVTAPKLGMWAVLVFGGITAWAFWRGRRKSEFMALLPWLAAGGFAITNAFLQALGRSAISIDRSILPRYASSTMMLGLGIMAAIAIILHRLSESGRQRAGVVAAMLLAAYCGLQVSVWDYGKHKMEAWRNSRLEEKFAITYWNVKVPEAQSRIDKDPKFVGRQIAVLNREGLLDPPLAESMSFGPFPPVDRDLPVSRSNMWRVVASNDKRLMMRGYAEFGGDDNRPCDGIIIGYRAHDGDEWTVFDLIETRPFQAPMAFVHDGYFGAAGHSYSKIHNRVSWDGALDISGLPAVGEIEIKAWVVDVDRRESVGIKQTLIIDRSTLVPGTVLVDDGKPVKTGD